MTNPRQRNLGHRMLIVLERIEVRVAPRRAELAEVVADDIDELRAMVFKLIGTRDPEQEEDLADEFL